METILLHPQSRDAVLRRWRVPLLLGGIFLFTLAALLLVSFPTDRIRPNTFIQDIPVGKLTLQEAHTRLEEQLPLLPNNTVALKLDEETFATPAASLGLHYDLDTVLAEACNDCSYSILRQLASRIESLWKERKLTVPVRYHAAAVDSWVQEVSQELFIEGEDPSAKAVGRSYTIDPGKLGRKVITSELSQKIQSSPTTTEHTIPLEITHTPLSADGQIQSEERLDSLLTKSLILDAGEHEADQVVGPSTYFAWLALPEGYKDEALNTYIDELSKPLEREPIEPVLELTPDAKEVTKFAAPQDGRTLNRQALKVLLTQRLESLRNEKDPTPEQRTIQLPLSHTPPKTSLESLNTLGIKEVIGEGSSRYEHSIPNRVHNVGLTAERVHAALVAPGEEFSFNKELGEVSQRTGFKTAYVIRDGRTQLGDGGGVCQVSTTVFRAALDAGFTLTEWHHHSYRVSYYEEDGPPGRDATVYGPTVDLRFKNDTQHHILVATYPDSVKRHLRVEIWGTSDGRTSEVTTPVITNQRPAPAPLFVPDPSIPPGQRRQIDWAAAGATTRFHYTVKNADGSIKHERDFVSNFRPWQAVYLVGVQ